MQKIKINWGIAMIKKINYFEKIITREMKKKR